MTAIWLLLPKPCGNCATDDAVKWPKLKTKQKGNDMSAFDEDLFLKGLEQRKATLGAEYVEKNLAAADDFTRPFQEAMTAWCWGFGWGDDVIDAKTRSMMNLSMIGALGKMTEWETHCRGAISNGVSTDEIRAIIHVIGIYCGVPQALECFRVARRVIEEG
jgi:4-carboxymuconolactone decarboxylase